MENTPASVKVKDVHKAFGDGREKVLNGVSIDFPPGQLTYVLGPSGTGKSVMIKHILGLLQPDEGTVFVDGQDMCELQGRKLAEFRTIFGMLFQNSALFDDMTVFENVAFPLREHTKLGDDEIRTRVEKALSNLGMPSKHHHKMPNELSGGMRKRVGLARAIIREPRVLIYDEPTTGLDPVTRTTVDDLIAQLKRELQLTSIVISHDIPSALLLADRIAFLFGGKLVFWGTPEEFRVADHQMIRAFLEAEERTVEALDNS